MFSAVCIKILTVFSLSTLMGPIFAGPCNDLNCARKNIDVIDKKIVMLIGKRLAEVRRAGELKPKNKSIHDQSRENIILKSVSEQAEKAGYSGSIARSIFSIILKESNQYEQNTRDKNEVLRVCATGDYLPFSDFSKGKWSGEDIDNAKKLASYLRFKIKFVKTSWRTLNQDLSVGKCDIAMGGISWSQDRAQKFLLSDPTGTFGKIPLVRCHEVKQFQTLKSINQPYVRVVENSGGTNEQFAREKLKNAKLIILKNNKLPFQYLLMYKADVMITDNVEAIYKQKIMSGLCAVNPDKPFTKSYKVYVLPKRNELLLNSVNFWISKNKIP